MAVYMFKRPWRPWRLLRVASTWELRKACRGHFGRRHSARLRYQQIGAHSFYIRNSWGVVVASVFRVEVSW